MAQNVGIAYPGIFTCIQLLIRNLDDRSRIERRKSLRFRNGTDRMALENVHFKALINNDLHIVYLSWHPVCSYLRRSQSTEREKTMKNILKIIAITIAAGVGSIYATPTTPFLQIFDGTTTTTIMDNGPGDINPLVGAIAWNGVIGVWDINLDQGLTKPIMGSATNPAMDLSFSAHSTAGGTLQLLFVDSGFTFSGVGTEGIGGTAGHTVDSFVNINGTHVIHNGPFGPGAFSGTVSGSLSLGSTDLLALEVDITHTGSQLSTGDESLTTPDSGSAVALLGIALAGIEGVRRVLRARKS